MKKKIRIQENCTQYIKFPTAKRKIVIKFCLSGGKITYFSIQYLYYFNERWERITRYDTRHGYAHKHMLHYKKRKNDRELVLGQSEKYNDIFTESLREIEENYKKIEHNYFY